MRPSIPPVADGQLARLSPAQTERLAVLLRNESDVAYKRRVRRMLAYLDLAPGLRVLDCGTGMGFYAKAILDLYPDCRVWGIDYEDNVLRYAQGHLAERGVGLVRGDIHHLPYAAEQFDRVLMSEVLEHLTDDVAALREVQRVMKPGAVLAMTVPSQHYPYWYDPINRLSEAARGRPIRRGPFAGIWANHERLYTVEQVVGAVEAAGFRIERVEQMTHYCFPATQTLVYTIGKGLIDHNLLPGFVGRSMHRFRGEDNAGSAVNPLNWVLALFNWIDHFNEDPERMARKNTFVNIAVQARKV
jgi:ubiquinone/menaquinone biosynthesis C-methylase UbiE